MSIDFKTMEGTCFYLHSRRNRHSYPRSAYPLTHLLDDQCIQRRQLKQKKYFYGLKLLLGLLLIVTSILLCFRAHVHLYNLSAGPFHLNTKQFIRHVETFRHQTTYPWNINVEYIQVELGQSNVQNPASTYETIRQYSDVHSRRNHIATFKTLKNPKIFIKLPTLSQPYARTKLPFHFPAFSIATLQCIAKRLELNSTKVPQTFIEKSDYVNYINQQYFENATRFNIAVLSHCGILVGYLYEPSFEKAFIPTKEYQFLSSDVAFNAARSYYSWTTLSVGGVAFGGLLLIFLYFLTICVLNRIRLKFHRRFGFLSFPLDLLPPVLEELWLLNFEDTAPMQLLHLDDCIRQSSYRYNNQLIVISNGLGQLFVLLINWDLRENVSNPDDPSPFVICPANDIHRVTASDGILYGDSLSKIPWPDMLRDDPDCPSWLHVVLLEQCEDYKRRYECRLRNDTVNPFLVQNNGSTLQRLVADSNSDQANRRRRTAATRNQPLGELDRLFREENNYQLLALERQNIISLFSNRTTPASSEVIARFRMNVKYHPKFIDSSITATHDTCVICCCEFELNEQYSEWPCVPMCGHKFHSECMLGVLRKQNTCPLCRRDVPAAQMPIFMFPNFF